MKKLLLTSAGFENENLRQIFLQLVGKKPEDIRALWIPTAATDDDARAVLPKCMGDLALSGIPYRNITTYDLYRPMELEELRRYDTVYFCGGDPYYLLNRIRAVGFDVPLRTFVEEGGVYVGASAGSWIAVRNLPNPLAYVNCSLDCHLEEGDPAGPVDLADCPFLRLTNRQAVLVHGDACSIVE